MGKEGKGGEEEGAVELEVSGSFFLDRVKLII